MSTIQEQLLFTTLRVERLDTQGKVQSIGTGFLLSRPVGENAYKVYLVSNKHVLSGADSIAITFTRLKNGEADIGNTARVPITNVSSNVVGHPDPDVDIAVLACTNLFNLLPDQLYFKAVSYDMLSTFDEPELSIAENVYFVGYPDDRYDVTNNLPLIRMGLISSHPKYDFNGKPVFIIDAQVFPGSSGSPVYRDLTYEKMKNGQIALGKRNVKLLGIVSATMVRNNQLKAIQTGTNLVTQEVLGLGIVFKATAIRELIDSMPTDD